ncbi:hypothetical protein C7S20_06120 [Christiangramia fulva]|uniref:Uncharacterized protein n=1 Tax=Christiangramia fulva TaxID=2126553 RepID=A0A2R3Z3N3_9FLAO|nr:tetratricopeptide repeat protein [Christiangramia fulva]AVR44876.1 hypothetical protein C7S20_06120 [Christiangramia fulva]
MKNLILILFLSISAFSSEGQEIPQPLKDVSQDDLGNASDAFQEHFFEALKQKGIENYEKAINQLQQCLKIDDTQAVVFFELGKNYRELENYEQAISNFKKAHELEPKREAILNFLFQTYGMTEDYAGAIETVKKLIPMDPKYKEDLANLYLLNEEYDKALKTLDELDAKYGSNTYRTSLRRQIYARTNNTDAQVQNLRESIASNPDVEQNYLNLIYIYSDQGNEEEAFKVAQELLKTNPGSSLAHLALYKFYLNKDNPEAAIASMDIVFESEEIDAETKFKVLNDFLNYVQQNPKYEEQLIEAAGKLKNWENTPKIYEQLGEYYLKKGNKENALKFFELGIKEDQDNFQLIKNILILQLDFARFEEAKLLSENSLEIFPTQPLLYLFQGVALNKLSEFKKAEEKLKEGLDYLVEDREMESDFYLQLALSYEGMNEMSKAEEFRRKAENLKKEIN